jgi:transposase-like protein
LLSPRRPIDQALHAVIMQAYVEGVSTRSVDDLVQALGIDSGISKSQVSRICAKLDVEIDAFRNRSLAHIEFPYVYLDATYVKARDTDLHQVVSRAVVIATGITANGDREVLGLAVGDSEEETFWTEFLRSLRRRGLAGVRLVISDAHEGLKTAARKTLQGASWQRCRVHFARNVLARVPKGHQDVVAAALRTVFVHPNPDEISAAWDRTGDMFARQFPKVKELMDSAKGDVLAFSAFPPDHWRKIWSNNPLERLNKEIQTTHQRRADLPQQRCHHPPRRAPCSPSNTTIGQPTATTSPKPRWHASTQRAILTTSQTTASSPSPETTRNHTADPTTSRDAVLRFGP